MTTLKKTEQKQSRDATAQRPKVAPLNVANESADYISWSAKFAERGRFKAESDNI
jgi:hypothetical protein